MSKVRNALRVAGTWPQPEENLPTQPRPAVAAKSGAEPGIVAPSPAQAHVPRPIVARWFRGIRRWMGLRVSGPAPRCSGLTRRGVPCRAPAMANGFCRMHGGANAAPVGRWFMRSVLSRFAKS